MNKNTTITDNSKINKTLKYVLFKLITSVSTTHDGEQHKTLFVANTIIEAAQDNNTPFTLSRRKVAINIDGRNWILKPDVLTWLVEAVAVKAKVNTSYPFTTERATKYTNQLRHTVGKIYFTNLKKVA